MEDRSEASAGQDKDAEVISYADAGRQYAEFELVKVLYEPPSEAFPQGFRCLLKIPRAKIAEVIAKGGRPPFWRHGELLRIRQAQRTGNAADAQ